MRKISALLLIASLLLFFDLATTDGSDMICINKMCLEIPCNLKHCRGLCSSVYPRGWGECLAKNPKCCQCNWACG